VEGVAKATRVARRGGEMARDRLSLVGTKHLERDRRPAPRRDQLAHDPRLQTVVIGVVVLLSQQDVATRDETRHQRFWAERTSGRDVPDGPHERVLATERTLPLRNRRGSHEGKRRDK